MKLEYFELFNKGSNKIYGLKTLPPVDLSNIYNNLNPNFYNKEIIKTIKANIEYLQIGIKKQLDTKWNKMVEDNSENIKNYLEELAKDIKNDFFRNSIKSSQVEFSDEIKDSVEKETKVKIQNNILSSKKDIVPSSPMYNIFISHETSVDFEVSNLKKNDEQGIKFDIKLIFKINNYNIEEKIDVSSKLELNDEEKKEIMKDHLKNIKKNYDELMIDKNKLLDIYKNFKNKEEKWQNEKDRLLEKIKSYEILSNNITNNSRYLDIQRIEDKFPDMDIDFKQEKCDSLYIERINELLSDVLKKFNTIKEIEIFIKKYNVSDLEKKSSIDIKKNYDKFMNDHNIIFQKDTEIKNNNSDNVLCSIIKELSTNLTNSTNLVSNKLTELTKNEDVLNSLSQKPSFLKRCWIVFKQLFINKPEPLDYSQKINNLKKNIVDENNNNNNVKELNLSKLNDYDTQNNVVEKANNETLYKQVNANKREVSFSY